MDKVREDAQRSVLLSCQVVLDFGLKHNKLLGTTTAKQPERTPTLGLIRDVTPVQAALADFSPTYSGRREHAVASKSLITT